MSPKPFKKKKKKVLRILLSWDMTVHHSLTGSHCFKGMYCLHCQGLVSSGLEIHSKCHSLMTVTQHHIPDPPNPQLHHCKGLKTRGIPFCCHPHKVAGLKKITVFSLEVKLEPVCSECTTANNCIRKISVIHIYMIKYSSLQLLCKTFVCWTSTTSTQKKDYTSSPKPHSKRVIPK